MKILSWNVNGIRSILKKGFLDFVRNQGPDLLCLQEVRADRAAVDFKLPGYRDYWNSAESRAGYSGTAVWSRLVPLEVFYGMGAEKHDREGRILGLEFKSFYLVNVYTPNSKRDLSRLPYREEWDRDFLEFLKKLEQRKPVVFCGDLNVAHKEIDLANPESNRGNHGFTDEERAGFDRLLESGFLDTFREFSDEGGHYTWWSQMNGCRSRNVGWRIDYVCLSKSLRPYLHDAFILPEVMGSDHCPVGIDLKLN